MLAISVITVTYNCEDTIERTIQSVISQPYESIDFIIIDGGSIDNTPRIINKYKKYLSYYISEPDSGIYEAMNKGIAASKGNGVIFLNAGDYFVGDVFNGASSPSLIPVRYKNFLGKSLTASLKNMYFGMPYCHQGIIFKKNDIKYDDSYKISADYDFFLNHFKDLEYELKISVTEGYVFFDNQGISSKNTILRDKETIEIIRGHYGPIMACISSFYFASKKIIKFFMTR
ncbi:glycosyltransferase [Candidatus Thioglobus sp.]|nr:glycosyltransferase [Candidatus Thioglobus sp.]